MFRQGLRSPPPSVVVPYSHPLASVRVLLSEGDHLCLYPCDEREHVCHIIVINYSSPQINLKKRGKLHDAPLQVIRSWILMFPLRTEWADISRRIVHKSMPDHLVFSFESFPSDPSWTVRNWTVVWAFLRVHIGVGTV